ncbi:MAG: 7-carboxy-7-deazaguanine synthase QueE [Bdellovibrionales bacterium]|nr:7-carboxy-7-deazaguanine synthase QueE [Bdellovibrionales bacterium]
MLKINEIFFSIQGESTRAGLPTLFIRTSGCHLRCTYCDTTYAYHEGEKKNHNEIFKSIESYPTKFVCVTGGEPLLQPGIFSFLTELCNRGYDVSLETSGDISCKPVDSRVLKIIDIKTPDSGEFGKFHEDNLNIPGPTEYKFVICSEKDFTWSEDFCKKNHLERFTVLYSPSYLQVEPKWLAEKILHGKSYARLQLQLHKYIWNPNKRGV